MSQHSSSRRDIHHLSLFNKNSSRQGSENSKSIADNIEVSRYEETADNYRDFLGMFEDKLEKVFEKENYRIYLNDRMNQKTYLSLVNEKDSLVKAIEESKDYRKSANRQLIEQVMNLQKQCQQYIERNEEVKNKIKNKTEEINKRRRQLKQLEKEIKSYWIYSYDLTNGNDSSMSTIYQRGNANLLGGSVVVGRYGRQGKENDLVSKSIIVNANLNSSKSSVYLPAISPKPLNTSQINTSATNQSITLFSKDLSLINNSPTREKLIQKINQSCKQQAQNKLSYQRQKISLIKMFIAYIKKIQDSHPEMTDRLKLEKVARQLESKIAIKENKLNRIQSLIK